MNNKQAANEWFEYALADRNRKLHPLVEEISWTKNTNNRNVTLQQF